MFLGKNKFCVGTRRMYVVRVYVTDTPRTQIGQT